MKKMKAVKALALALGMALAFIPAKTALAEGETTDPTLTGEENQVERAGVIISKQDYIITKVGDNERTEVAPGDTVTVSVDPTKVPKGSYVKAVLVDRGSDMQNQQWNYSLGDFTGGTFIVADDATEINIYSELDKCKTYSYDLSSGSAVEFDPILFTLFEGCSVEYTSESMSVDLDNDEVIDAIVYNNGTMKKAEGATGTKVIERPGKCISEVTVVLGAAEDYNYELIEDDKTVVTYIEGEDGSVSLHISGPYELFDSLDVDGNPVKPSGTTYSVGAGSTIVTFAKDFLATLSEGEHKVVVKYTNGKSVSATITKKAAATAKEAEVKTAAATEAPKNDSVKTGDNMLMVFPIMAFAAIGIVALGMMKKKEE